MNEPDHGIRLDHIGIAASDLAAARELWNGVLGLPAGEPQDVPGMGVRVQKFRAGEVEIEILEDVTGGDGVIGKYLARSGPGIHHLSFVVDDLEATTRRLAAAGYRLVYDSPRTGAGGVRVNFLHPKGTQGVLIELVQEPGR